jgi:hypothetical protein
VNAIVGPKPIMEKQLSDFISAGFLVTREVDRPSYVSAELLPARMISASGCIAPFVPDTWCIEWTQDASERRIEHAGAFGLDSQALRELTACVTPRFDKSFRWSNVIVDLDTAHELVSRFLSTVRDVKVLELGLHRSMTDDFCQKAEPPAGKPGFAPLGRQGVHEVILEGNPPTQTGKVLGFEPLVFNDSLSCSWLCNGLENAIAQALGIKPNRHALIEMFDDARQCVEYISRDDVRAEPGLWLPWLIIDHT